MELGFRFLGSSGVTFLGFFCFCGGRMPGMLWENGKAAPIPRAIPAGFAWMELLELQQEKEFGCQEFIPKKFPAIIPTQLIPVFQIQD